MKKIIILLTLVYSAFLSANDASDNPEAFMKELLLNKHNKAVDNYFSSNPLINEKQQQIRLVKSQINNLFNLFGNATAYELAFKETISPSLKRFVYILKHSNHPTVWEFFIYKVKDTWISSNMSFNDNFELLKKYQ